MAKGTPKWMTAENLAAALESFRLGAQFEQAKVLRNVRLRSRSQPKRKRQVDVLLRVPVGDREFRIGIEVKDRGRPVNIEDVDAAAGKLKDLPLDRYGILSTSGFTEAARERAQAECIEAIEVTAIPEGDDHWVKVTPINFHLEIRQVRFHFEVGPAPEAQGSWDDYQVVAHDGSTASLLTAAKAALQLALETGQLEPDGPDASNWTFGILGTSWRELHRCGERMDMPLWVQVFGSGTMAPTATSTSHFETKAGLHAAAHVYEVEGKEYQLSVVSNRMPLPDARIHMDFSPARPPPIDIETPNTGASTHATRRQGNTP